MTAPLVVIESAGKLHRLRAALHPVADRLWRGRMPWIVATIGHLLESPRDLSVLGLDQRCVENMRAPRRAGRVEALVSGASGRALVLLMTDPDIEGDVIAADAARILREAGYAGDLLRVLLNSIEPDAIQRAIECARPIDPAAAIPGYARSALDRLVGATFSSSHRPSGRGIAVGRTLTPLLGTADGGGLPVGEVVIRRRAATGPDFAGTFRVATHEHARRLAACSDPDAFPPVQGRDGGATPAPDLATVIETFAREEQVDPGEAMQAIQGLYETGQISYPRTLSREWSNETRRQVARLARIVLPSFANDGKASGKGEDSAAASSGARPHAHEALHPIMGMQLTAEPGADRAARCLASLSRLAYAAAIAPRSEICEVEVPGVQDGAVSRIELRRGLNWAGGHPGPAGNDRRPHGFRPYSRSDALFSALAHGPVGSPPGSRLGSPSTWTDHARRFTELVLVDDALALTAKGRKWAALSPRALLSPETASWIEQALAASVRRRLELEDASASRGFGEAARIAGLAVLDVVETLPPDLAVPLKAALAEGEPPEAGFGLAFDRIESASSGPSPAG